MKDRGFTHNLSKYTVPTSFVGVVTPTGMQAVYQSHCKLLQLPFLVIGQALGKLQGKVVRHSEEVGWWRNLMVECVTLF